MAQHKEVHDALTAWRNCCFGTGVSLGSFKPRCHRVGQFVARLESGEILGVRSKRVASFELACEPNRRLEQIVHGLDSLPLSIVLV
jgi:hypothetical protein